MREWVMETTSSRARQSRSLQEMENRSRGDLELASVERQLIELLRMEVEVPGTQR